MPIDIDVFSDDRLKVTICEPTLESQVSVLLAGLLTSQLVRAQGFWTLSFNDFRQLKIRLDALGLTAGRTATDEALRWLAEKQAAYDAIERVKTGEENAAIGGLSVLKIKPYEDQVTGVRFLMTRQRAVLADEMGVGKAQPIDAKLLTPTGWKCMGSVRVGDKVIGRNGRATRVVGVYSRGVRPVFSVVFSDGSSTECCDDHLWLVNTALRKWQRLSPRVKPLRELRQQIQDKNGNRKHFIPLVDPVCFTSTKWKKVGIDPYVLGCLLGDGGLTVASCVGFTSCDLELVQELQRCLPKQHRVTKDKHNRYGYHVVGPGKRGQNSVLNALRTLRLHGLKSEYKFIPESFKFSPALVREQLLQGLLDTDGSACANGTTVEYASSSKQLADDVLFLVRSLGGVATLKKKQTLCLPSYRLHIALPNSISPFRLPRKARMHKPRVKYQPTRAIVSIVPAGEKETRCIAVAAKDQLYVTDDFIVTHNTLQLLATFLALRAASEAKHMLVVCPNSVKTAWIKEVQKHTDLTVSAVGNGSKRVLDDIVAYSEKRTDVLVMHYDSLVQQAKNGETQTKPWSKAFEELLKLPWDVIVLDEAHQVKTMDSRRTQSTLLLTRSAHNADGAKPRVYMATGTPISESPLDAWSVLSFLDPLSLPRTFTKFESYFTTKTTRHGFTRVWKQTVGYRNLFELKDILHHVMLRRLKVDIKGMPDKVEQVRYVSMHGEQRRLYDDIKAGVYDTILHDPNDKLSIAFAMTKCLRMRQVLNHPKLVEKDGYSSAKYEALDEVLDEVLSDPMAKAVVWTEWREAAHMLMHRYAKKYGAITLIGGTTQNELAHYSANWDVMPERVAVCTPQFGGTGVDFLQRCRTAIYVEPPYSTILFRQSMDRIHRRVANDGTEMDRIKASPATLIFLQVEQSIDQLVYKLLAQKGNLVDALLTDNEKLIELGKAELLQFLR